MTKVGFNINLDDNNIALIDFLHKRYGYDLLLTTNTENNMPTSLQFNRIRKFDDIIWEHQSNSEKRWYRYGEPHVFKSIYSCYDLHGSKKITSVFNNPSLYSNNYMVSETFVKHEIEMVKAFSDIGIKYYAGCFTNNTPHNEVVKVGVFNELFEAVNENGGGLFYDIKLLFPFVEESSVSLFSGDYVSNLLIGDKTLDMFDPIALACEWHKIDTPKIIVKLTLDTDSFIDTSFLRAYKDNFGLTPTSFTGWQPYFEVVFGDKFVDGLLGYVKGVFNKPFVECVYVSIDNVLINLKGLL